MGVTINAAPNCSGLGDILDKVVNGSPVAAKALSGCSFDIGLASDSRYGVPATAQDAIFVGDSKWIDEDPVIDAATKMMFERHPDKVQVKPVYNKATNKWQMKFSQMAGDAVDFIAGQLFSPWNISYMSKVFKEPLAYSNVDKYVSYDSGSNPWAEIFTLFLEQYSGWAMAGQTGSLQNIMTSDVNVKDGMMSAPVINISGTYSLTLEEQTRPNDGPLGMSPMTRKQSYLNYAMNMLKAKIAIYGNEETDTDGLMQVSPINVVPLAESIKYLKDQTQPGYKIYRMLADLINERITISDGKFKRFCFVMSPEALAYLRSTPYSEIYDPTSAMKIFMKNYGAQDKDGQVPNVDFISEPLLKANSLFNPTSADYSMLLCPDVEAGPTEESQPNYIFGAPLQKFVFPAIPGQYNTQYKTLARLAGIIAPIPAAVKLFHGLGTQD
jgi:hypothetical protein